MKVRNGYGLGFTTFSRMILGAALALAILGGGISIRLRRFYV